MSEKSVMPYPPIQHRKVVHKKTRKAVSFQADLQNVLIMLLSKHADIYIGKTSKKAKLTTQFHKIKSIKINDEVLDVVKFIKKRCDALTAIMCDEGVKIETVKRRMQPAKRMEAFHLLEDFVAEFGYIVINAKDESDGIVGDAKIISAETGKVLYETTEIKELGTKASRYISSIVSLENEVLIKNMTNFM
ncbi:hypothetical protein EIN_052090 [Entamoeba invadens IP1]|uniref:hypothetical protein n=1 Tax=Entamoeba invadens IP1 TaxID=370355 RepID=UPI0002C3D0CF|nr:hypothetical protein EIN_052090 [Entamoeba invadens IP1]ELP93014.1 hypothetical protein EIN_052090 [Entamoeba invadens IP1]|eukprot:XP_004259785.1 hypothetical protein EIN_052090 [Entamoeba invadens IP1]